MLGNTGGCSRTDTTLLSGGITNNALEAEDSAEEVNAQRGAMSAVSRD